MKARIQKIAVLGALAACQGADSKSESPPTTPDLPPTESPKTTTSAAQEVRSAYRKPELAFKTLGSRFEASYQTHLVSVTKGAITVTPKLATGEHTNAYRFETADISRGKFKLDNKIGATKVAMKNELHVDRGALVEQIENREDGVEQRWTFATDPAGRGDLVVRVGVDGYDASHVASTTTGLHFFASTGLGVRYSHATWLDNAGSAWEVPVAWEQDQIVIRVPEALLEASTYPATLDPVIEGEEAVDDAVPGNSGANASSPSLATRGQGFLAMWSDNRLSNRADIFAARVTASGTILDKGFLVNGAAETQTTPVGARVGNTWLVAWRTVQDIGAATVGDDAVVTQLGNVAATAANEQLPALASNDTNAVLAWQSGSDIQASIFNGGSFGSAFSLAATAASESDPALASDGSGYLATWTDDGGVKAQLLTSGGALSGTVIDVAPGASQAAVAFNGTDYIVAFVVGVDLHARRVSTTGTLIDAMTVPVVTAAGAQSEPSISCSSSCVILYSDTRAFATNGFDVYGQRVNLDLTAAGAEFPVSTAERYQVAPSVVLGTAGWLSIWEDQRTGGSAIAMASRIDSSGAVLDASGVVVNISNNAEVDAATSSIPNSTHLVAWSDSRTTGNDILGVRYASTGGARLDSQARTISGAANDQATPTLAYNGTNFVAAWSDVRGADRDIYAALVAPDGTVGQNVAVSTATREQFAPDVASANGVSLVVWMDRRSGVFDIYGAILGANGAVTVPDIAISTAANDQNLPAVTYDPNSSTFVVIWSDQRGPGVADIYGTRVSTAGLVLDPNGVLVSGGNDAQVQPDLAVSGTQIMAVWDDRRTDPTGDIIGTRLTVDANGLNVLDAGGIPISYIPPGRQNAPTVIGTPGGRWLVAWADQRDLATTGTDVYGVELSTMGTPTNSTGFAIAATAGNEANPSFQNDLNNDVRVALMYQYYRADLATTRVFRRLISVDPPPPPQGNNGTICVTDSQCGSGFCVDSRCCDSACGGSFNHSDCQTCSTHYGGTVDGMCTVIVTESICRNFGTYECDLREYCDGVNPSCPPDEGRNSGQPCTTSGGGAGTCPADAPPGPHVCQ